MQLLRTLPRSVACQVAALSNKLVRHSLDLLLGIEAPDTTVTLGFLSVRKGGLGLLDAEVAQVPASLCQIGLLLDFL